MLAYPTTLEEDDGTVLESSSNFLELAWRFEWHIPRVDRD